MNAARIDPPGCGCTDCITGYSVALDSATDTQVYLAAAGCIADASGVDWREVRLRAQEAADRERRAAVAEYVAQRTGR